MKVFKKLLLIVLSIIGAIFCTWAFWDIPLWISSYPNALFPFPFNLIRVQWWIADDFFTVVLASFITILGFIALENERAKDDQADKDRALIRENINEFKALIDQLKQKTKPRKSKDKEKKA